MSRSKVLLLCVLTTALLLFVGVHWGAAQDGAAGAAAAAAPDGAANAANSGTGESPVWWFIRSSGLIGAFILALSIYFVATVIRLFIEMRQEVASPPELVKRCEELIQGNDLAGMYTLVRNDDSMLGRVLSTGLSDLSSGMSQAREAMDRIGDAETVNLEKQISMLAVLGTLGPMIGLIGTLKGMITSFSVIAMSGTQLKPNEVAGGISEALILTFEGVALSVPAIYFFAFFRNRVAAISASTMVQADDLLRRVSHAIRGVNPSNAAALAAPATPPPVRSPEGRTRTSHQPESTATA